LSAGSAAFGADPIAQVFDGQVSTVEREVLGLAQAMPADKYDFAPTNGTFTGVRTFALQVRHAATEIYAISSAILGEKPPVDTGATDNGPDSLKSKDQIVEYFKGAIAFAHKAMNSLTEQNMTELARGAPGGTRLGAAAFLGLHSYDHYGQMVVYARMNGVIPPSSQPRPPGSFKGKSK
jgi:hypothetical protein